jgi:diguanylate cyclase
MSGLDELTNLLTIQSFHERMEDALRSGNGYVLVAMDLDHFKAFNDRYGHVPGDEFIRISGQLINEAFSAPGSLVARYGGDEFMALVPASDLYETYEKAETLRHRFERNGPVVLAEGQEIHHPSTISLGLAAYPANASSATELVEKGKQALTRAKIAGGNRVCFYQEADPLTGLLNRYASYRALDEAITHTRQSGEPVSVFLLDIDQFTQINDEYGHRAGDEVLSRLGKILQNNFKDSGSVGRTGGDEFLVTLPGQRADSAFVLAEEVRRLVEDSEIRTAVGPHTYILRFRISGGIATFPGDAGERVDLLRKADEALYRSKRIGRNRISLPASSQMVTKTAHFSQIQLERLSELARKLDKTEAFLLREALDELLRKYMEGGN